MIANKLYLFRSSGAHGSVVMGIKPVTERVLVQTLLQSLVMWTLTRHFIYIVSVHPAEIWYRLTLGVNLGWTGVPSRGVNDSQPLRTTRLLRLQGTEKDLTFFFKPSTVINLPKIWAASDIRTKNFKNMYIQKWQVCLQLPNFEAQNKC